MDIKVLNRDLYRSMQVANGVIYNGSAGIISAQVRLSVFAIFLFCGCDCICN